MEHNELKKIIRRQLLPKLIFPLVLTIVSTLFIIINPFKNALRPVTINSLSEIEDQYDKGNKYIKYTANKLYYSGFDYNIGNKTKANVYYTLSNGHCYYIVIDLESNNGIAKILDNFTFSAQLVKNNELYSSLNQKLAEQINFSEKRLEDISCSIIISQYNYTRDFTRLLLIMFYILLISSFLGFIFELVACINVFLSHPVISLRKYGDPRTLFTLAVSELDTATPTDQRNVFITDTFLIIITKIDTDIIPLENITWVYDYNEIHHKKGKTKMYHPICIITDIKKMYKIRHVSESGIKSIFNALSEKHPEIMVGYKN